MWLGRSFLCALLCVVALGLFLSVRAHAQGLPTPLHGPAKPIAR